MPQQTIKLEFLKTTLSDTAVPVVRIWYGETDITVAFAAAKLLPVFPVRQDPMTIWGVLANAGRSTLRTWIDEFVTGSEMRRFDMSYPRIENPPQPKL